MHDDAELIVVWPKYPKQSDHQKSDQNGECFVNNSALNVLRKILFSLQKPRSNQNVECVKNRKIWIYLADGKWSKTKIMILLPEKVAYDGNVTLAIALSAKELHLLR